MKNITKYSFGAAGGMGLMIAAVIIMFMYQMMVSLPPAHLGFLGLLMFIVPFMAPVAFIMGLTGFFIFLIAMVMVMLKGK